MTKPTFNQRVLRATSIGFLLLAFQGCAVQMGDYRFSLGENIQAAIYIADTPPPPPAFEVFVPDVLIVEGMVQHDYFFYRSHPEIYHLDRVHYPERFAHGPHRSGSSGKHWGAHETHRTRAPSQQENHKFSEKEKGTNHHPEHGEH